MTVILLIWTENKEISSFCSGLCQFLAFSCERPKSELSEYRC